jgi:hypothetical protein
MTAMRMPCVAILCCVALAACDQSPTFDASSPGAYQRSLGEITAQLGADEQRRLRIALVTLALGNTPQTNAIELANPALLNDIVTLATVSDPQIYLDRVRPSINGRTAAGVIRLVAANLDSEISQAEAKSAGAEKLLAGVAIGSPRYYWDRSRNLPTIEFSVYNGNRSPISRLYVSGVVTMPGRTGKWATGGLNYRFDSGLDPGEQVPVKLTPRIVSMQTAKELQSLYNVDITVKVTNIEDATGHKLVPIDADVLEGMRSKRDFLRGS